MAASSSNGTAKRKGKQKPATSGYKPLDMRWWSQPRDLPLMGFREILAMLREPTIRLGLAMRVSPVADAKFKVRASSETIERYVQRQLAKVWENLSALDSSHVWGWSACEVMTARTLSGTVEITELLPRHSNDVRAIVADGRVCGVQFRRIENRNQGNVELAVAQPHPMYGPPKAIFHAHDPYPGMVYGRSILDGAFSPWCDKWLRGGALDVRRLTMMMYSVNGRRLYYPDGMMEIPGYSEPVPYRDVAKQIIEQMMSGAPLALPSDIDPVTGKQRWDLQEATSMTGLEYVLKYPQDLDVEMLRGMEIPDDVITSQAESSGAWAGKQVPQAAFYTGLTRWLRRMILDIRYCILDYLVAFNFGAGHWFEIEPVPLAEQTMKQQKKPEDSQNSQQPPKNASLWPTQGANAGGEPSNAGGARMSLDPVAAVGQGVLDAGELVKAASRVIRMSADQLRAPKGGVTIKGQKYPGGEWIPKGVVATLSNAERQKIKAGVFGAQQTRAAKTIRTSASARVPAKPLSDKAARAKASHKLVDKTIQRYAEEHNEPAFAKAIGGVSFPNGEPIDVAVAGADGTVAHGIELKTMVNNKANKITMKRDAMERKALWERKNKAPIHTVVIDDSAAFNANGDGQHDLSKRRIFYRRGYGSFRVGTMQEVRSMKELKHLMNLPNDALPNAAMRPAGQKLGKLAA
jgi:hypothetical protein